MIRSQYRFFLPSGSISGGEVRFPPPTSKQMFKVLRLRKGDHVVVLDGTGAELEVELQAVGAKSMGTVIREYPNESESEAKVHVFLALLKSRKVELVLQKCTELGAVAFTPVVCERSLSEPLNPNRAIRCLEIIREAAEQSGRGMLPLLHEAVPFHEAISNMASPALLFSKRDGSNLPTQRLPGAINGMPGRDVAIFIGPEGGFSEEELCLARKRGILIVTLGRRILRAETASIVATALVLHHLERE